MISNKTLATLFLITLNMQHAAASSSDGTQEPSSSDKLTLKKRQGPALKPKTTTPVLRDTTSTVSPVEIQGGSTEMMNTSQELSVPQVDNQFKAMIEKGEFWKIFEIGKKMNNEEFLKQLCPVVKTPVQYVGIFSYLKHRNLMTLFYVHGDIGVVKWAIVRSKVYDKKTYVDGGVLETALPLALKEDRHDRFVEFLDIRKGITAEVDGRLKQGAWTTSFDSFVYHFLKNFAPWEDGMALRRFLILRGEELRTTYPDILDTLCQESVYNLRGQLHLPKAERLLADLIGQPSLLTPATFARGFLYNDNDRDRSNLIKYGYREAVQEGLKSEYPNGCEWLWRVMRKEKPDQFPGQFPETEEARAAACMHIPTKQQMEEEWIKNNEQLIRNNAKILYNKLKPRGDIFNILPDVIWPIVFSYAATPIDLEDLTASQE